MKYLKLIWLIASGRLSIEKRNAPEKKGRPTRAGGAGHAYPLSV
jgi:hypothetical protein